MGGRGVIVVVIALVLGILILKNGFSSSASPGGSSSASHATTTTTAVAGTTTAAAPPTTAVDKSKFTVIVANASGISGAAGRLTDKMKSDGYVMAPATTAKAQQSQSAVYFISGYDAQGADVAAYLNIQGAQPMPSPPPVDIGQAQVLVMEGKDIASSASSTATTAKASSSTTAKPPATTVPNTSTTKKG